MTLTTPSPPESGTRSLTGGRMAPLPLDDHGGWARRLADVGERRRPHVGADDAAARFPAQAFADTAETGLFALPLNGDRRTCDASIPALLAGIEALAYASDDAGLAFAVATQLASAIVPIARFGSPALREELALPLAGGALIGAHAITEPSAGSDTSSLATTARLAGDAYVLEGEKAFVSSGPVADLIVVYARVGGPGEDAGGLTAFAVDAHAPGVQPGPALATMGLRTSPLGTLSLTGARVPAGRVIGQVGAGSWLLSHVMAREILFIAAGHVGLMRRRYERMVARARSRQQGGGPIGGHQAVAHAIADVKLALDTTRLWLDHAASTLVSSGDAPAEIASLKIVASEAAVRSAQTAVQVFGGEGFLTSTEIERGLRDATASTIYSGTNEVQRNKIAALAGITTPVRAAW